MEIYSFAREYMAEHIRGVYTITDGDLMLEVNALPDKFCITFQRFTKKADAVNAFCAVLDGMTLGQLKAARAEIDRRIAEARART